MQIINVVNIRSIVMHSSTVNAEPCTQHCNGIWEVSLMEELITLQNVLWQRLERTMMISRVKVTIIISDDDNINDAKASKQ